MKDKINFSISGFSLKFWDGLSQVEVSILINEKASFPFCCLREWSKSTQGNKIECSGSWKKLQGTLTAVYGIVSCAAFTCATIFIDVGHMRLVNL